MKVFSILSALVVALLAPEVNAGAYVDAVLADNPSAYYRFEDASTAEGAPAADSSTPNSPTATYHANPSPIATTTGPLVGEPSNTALDFINVQGAGESQRVSVGAAPGFAQVAPTGNFTIEWWAKVETSHAGVEGSMVSFTSAAGHYDVGYNYETDTPYVQVYPVIDGAQQAYFLFRGDPNVGGTNASAPQHPDNLDHWFHYALVIGASDSSTTGDDFASLYINAQLVGSMAGITNTGFNPTPYVEGFYLGQAYDDRQFLGQLDDVSVYQQALSPVQIATHYAAAQPEIPADFNGNLVVDGADLEEWKADFGGPGSDADGDGDSDGNDFLIWQRNLSQPGAATAAAPVPEATTAVLACVAAAGLALIGSRRRVSPRLAHCGLGETAPRVAAL